MGGYASSYFGVWSIRECFDMDNGLHFRRRKCYMYEAQTLATLYFHIGNDIEKKET